MDSHSTADEARAVSVAAVDDENSKLETESLQQPEPQEPKIIETRIDDDIAIQEPTIERIDVNDLDDSEAHVKSKPTVDEKSQMSVKVKEEPKDDDEMDEEDELFEDVGTIESSMVESSAKETGKNEWAFNFCEFLELCCDVRSIQQ